MNILIGTPIHQIKDYCLERWLQNVVQLQQEYPTDLLLVDNSPNLDYLKKVKGYCTQYGVKNYQIKHLEIGDLQGKDEKIGRSREIIRQQILANDYDAWFSWESDQIIPPDTLSKLSRIMEAGNYTMIHPNSWARELPAEPEAGFGVCLIRRWALEKFTFLLDTPHLRNCWFGGEAWFKKQVLETGGNYIEVYGLVEPNTPQKLREMLVDYYQKQGMKKYASDFWIFHNNLHITELLNSGYDSFKHTIAVSYFTWLPEPTTPQPIASHLSFLISNLSEKEISSAKTLVQKLPIPPHTTKKFNFVTLLLWQYVKNQGLKKELAQLSEPPEGSPPAMNFEGRLISQDIANSLLEIDTIRKHTKPDSIRTILEIGAGYGRSAYIWLHLDGVKKYIIVDIPPALYISQKYLSSQFPKKRIFRYRDFHFFNEIKDEYRQAELIFLMPWQVEMLPEKDIDLIQAIDCLNEMKFAIIGFYFRVINKLCRKYFYIKCNKNWDNEDGIIKRGDYPIPTTWKCLLDRECRVQTDYFEALYRTK